MGAGKFDGAWLVREFRESESGQYALDQAVQSLFEDRHARLPAISEFERWWGGHVNLNAEEIQFIVDELFIGNNLAAGRIQTSDGMAVDLRNIRSPIVVFCSKGDNITPPQQALGWILDLYEDVDEIRAYGQTIVYTIHESVGPSRHLRFRRRRQKRARRIFQQYRPDRPFCPLGFMKPLRAQGGRRGQSRSRQRRLGHALRRADLDGHPRAWRPRA